MAYQGKNILISIFRSTTELCRFPKSDIMFTHSAQVLKAESFRQQHHGQEILMLPNIWDALGARLMEKIGYPSVATASVATALVNGFVDGEQIPYSRLLEVIHAICSAVDVPATVDIERGFALDTTQLKENIHLLIENGAVGINIEDSLPGHQDLYPIDEQVKKIDAVRETALQCGVPIVINARTDVFLIDKTEKAIKKGIERGLAYKAAGADCIYPVTISRYEDITQFVQELAMPINVLLMKSIANLKQLKNMGVARVSLGPHLLSHALSTMKEIAEGLMRDDTTVFFSREPLAQPYRDSLVRRPE